MGYRQLTQRQRYQIEAGLQHQCNLRTIAGIIAGMVTLVERRSNYLLAEVLPQLKAEPTAQAIIRQLRRIRRAVKTLTFDNGFEFADHQRVGQTLSAATYFCDPYRSSQRGTNENTNGLLRQYSPKGTDFRKVSDR